VKKRGDRRPRTLKGPVVLKQTADEPSTRERWFSALTYAVIPLLVLAVVLVYVRFFRAPPVPAAGLIWVYDLQSAALTVAPADAAHLPPFDAPSGPTPDGKPAGVWAAVFACGSCANQADRFVGWIETLTPELRDQLKPIYLSPERPDALDDLGPARVDPKSRFIADPDKKEWHDHDSPHADAIRRAVKTRCKGATAVTCAAVP
jgi:hypothetical protein